jgi:steroid 5-alpha reductase family enzyme
MWTGKRESVDVWSHIAKHGEEIGWAVGLGIPFAIVFAIIVDILGVGARSREAFRQFRNRMAEQSTSRLAKRIEQLQDYQKRLSSDRWLYLFSFQCIFLTLIMLSSASVCVMFTNAEALRAHPIIVSKLMMTGLMFFALGGGFAWAGLRHVYRDTPDKMQRLVRKVGHEIEGLEEKLARRSER